MQPVLAYVEHSLPGETPEARIETARRIGLALEVANRNGIDRAALGRCGITIVTVQAYGMHDSHPLHPDPARHESAVHHVLETIDLAVALRAPRVLTACGFGSAVHTDPFGSCVRFFRSVATRARERGVRILIEPLSPLRASAMTDPDEIAALLDELGQPEIFGTAIDTGHLIDGGGDPSDILARWPHRIDEIQLRGAGSRPPAPDLPIDDWLKLPTPPPATVVVEHGLPIDPGDLGILVGRLRRALGSRSA